MSSQSEADRSRHGPAERRKPATEDAFTALHRRLEPTQTEIDRFLSAASDADFARALARFANGLLYAGDLYERQEERLAVQAAVNAVIELISTTALGSPASLAALDKLRGALSDVDAGVMPPLLAPTRPSHRVPDPEPVQNLRALSAVTMQLLMEFLGYSKSNAAATVARELGKLGLRLGNSRNREPGTTIANWREHAKRGGPKHCVLGATSRISARDPISDQSGRLSSSDTGKNPREPCLLPKTNRSPRFC